MAKWISVNGLVNGQGVEAGTFNTPLRQLTQRTDYLYEQLSTLLGSGTFEAVKIEGVALADDVAIGDVVWLNTTTSKYEKALAAVSAEDPFTAASSARAIGLVIAAEAGTGTLVLTGKTIPATLDVPWTMQDLVQAGETFAPGPYYLSSVEAGKLTTTPTGIMIYAGIFTEDVILFNPQYRDTGEAHVHRAYPLSSQPAGYPVFDDPSYRVIGFIPVGTPDVGDKLPRLVITGTVTASQKNQYRIWLSNANSGQAPDAGFETLYVNWESSDPEEGSGRSRVWSFEMPFAIGTSLIGYLQNPDENSEIGSWDTPYTAVSDPAGEKRTWIINVPDDTAGWLECRYRQLFEASGTSSTLYSFRLLGGPALYADKRTSDTLNIRCAEIHQIQSVQPMTGTTLVVSSPGSASVTYEFLLEGDTPSEGTIPVEIGSDASVTFQNLLDAILATNPLSLVPVLDPDTTQFLLGTDQGTSVILDGVVQDTVATGLGQLTLDTTSLLVYDQYHHTLVGAADGGYWSRVTFWTPITLTNGLTVLPVPYSHEGTSTGNGNDTVNIGDLWTSDITDEAPGAYFRYAIGMQPALASHYPPVPVQACCMVMNGVELESGLFFDSPAYMPGTSTLYWYSNTMPPWPTDWLSDREDTKNGVFYLVQGRIGDTGLVTSCRPAPGSPISITRCGTQDAATTGDLQFNLDLNMSLSDDGLDGYKVVKSASGSKLRTGPVVEQIIPGAGIIISQSQGAPTGRGKVTIALAGEGTYTGDFEEVALQNAKEELVGMFPYIKLLGWDRNSTTNKPTGITSKFRVPHTIPDVLYRVVVYATVFGETTLATAVQQTAGLSFSYSFLPDYTAVGDVLSTTSLKNALTSPVISSPVTFGADSLGYTAFDPILVFNNYPVEAAVAGKSQYGWGNEPFPKYADFSGTWTGAQSSIGVRRGSLVGIRIQRAPYANGDEYTGALGIINIRWLLVPITT